jgi:hypothetical protein
VTALETTRSAFIRQALRRHALRRLKALHRQGYERIPPDAAGVTEWAGEQLWGDAA